MTDLYEVMRCAPWGLSLKVKRPLLFVTTDPIVFALPPDRPAFTAETPSLAPTIGVPPAVVRTPPTETFAEPLPSTTDLVTTSDGVSTAGEPLGATLEPVTIAPKSPTVNVIGASVPTLPAASVAETLTEWVPASYAARFAVKLTGALSGHGTGFVNGSAHEPPLLAVEIVVPSIASVTLFTPPPTSLAATARVRVPPAPLAPNKVPPTASARRRMLPTPLCCPSVAGVAEALHAELQPFIQLSAVGQRCPGSARRWT